MATTTQIKVVFSKHAIERAGEREFPQGFLSVAEAAAIALNNELKAALTKAASMTSLAGQQFALKIGTRRFTASLQNGLRVATEVALGTHVAVIGMEHACVPTIITLKPLETRAKRNLKAARNAKNFK